MRGARILVHLTESGLIYLVIQVVRLALSLSVNANPAPRDVLSRVYGIFGAVTAIVTAMYTPALIIILKYGYSMTETSPSSLSSSTSSRPRRRRNSSIQFKSNTSSVSGAVCLEEEMLERCSTRKSEFDIPQAVLAPALERECADNVEELH